MALVQLQHVCFSPLARAVRPRALAVFPSRNFSIASPTRASQAESQHVLLGMSEPELQQLAHDFNQVKTQKTSILCLFHEKMKEID
jgi:23S rRNA (adenine2503-C2)-methyltransferase